LETRRQVTGIWASGNTLLGYTDSGEISSVNIFNTNGVPENSALMGLA
jgi:hypothetical protein